MKFVLVGGNLHGHRAQMRQQVQHGNMNNLSEKGILFFGDIDPECPDRLAQIHRGVVSDRKRHTVQRVVWEAQ